jgi:hypothetical protein
MASCFLTVANTTGRKVGCALIGVGILSGTAGAGYKAFQHRHTLLDKLPEPGETFDRVIGGFCLVNGVLLSGWGMWCTRDVWRDYSKSISSTTNCCAIVRRTMGHGLFATVPVGFVVCGAGFLLLGVRILKE